MKRSPSPSSLNPLSCAYKNDANGAAAAWSNLPSARPFRLPPSDLASSDSPLLVLCCRYRWCYYTSSSSASSHIVVAFFFFFAILLLPRRRPLLLAATLGATSKITASIDATTRLLDDPPMGRRREPRHPLGRGEREDRDRLKKQLKKAREKRRRRHQSSSSSSNRSKSGDGGGFEELEDILSDENDDASDGDHESVSVSVLVDTRAEAGGMGLLLVPLTPAGKPASPAVVDVLVHSVSFNVQPMHSPRTRGGFWFQELGFSTKLLAHRPPLTIAGMVSGQTRCRVHTFFFFRTTQPSVLSCPVLLGVKTMVLLAQACRLLFLLRNLHTCETRWTSTTQRSEC